MSRDEVRGGGDEKSKITGNKKNHKFLSLDCMQAVSQVFINYYINLHFYYIINCKIGFKIIT